MAVFLALWQGTGYNGAVSIRFLGGTMRSTWKTYLILFIGVFALSTSAIFAKVADAPASIIAFYRLLTAGVVLLPFFLGSAKCRAEFRTLQRGQWLRIVAAGFCLALHYVMWFESLNFTSIASSTVLVSLQPLFSLAFERVFSKKRVSPSALVGVAIALVGCFIIGSGDFQISGLSLWGDVLAFLAAGVIALYFFVGASVRQNTSTVTYSVLSYFVSAVILLVYSLLRGERFFGYEVVTWLSFLGLALICTIGGHFVFNVLLKDVPASFVTMSILGEPIGTCILAYLLLRESVAPQQLLGIVIIMAGMAVFFILPNRKR